MALAYREAASGPIRPCESLDPPLVLKELRKNIPRKPQTSEGWF